MYYQSFKVEGVENKEELDDGLVSLVEVPRKIKAIIINTSAHEGNMVQGWIGSKKVLEVYDYPLDTQEATETDLGPFSTSKVVRLPVDLDIPPGQIFKVGISCGTTASDIYGAYEYEEGAA